MLGGVRPPEPMMREATWSRWAWVIRYELWTDEENGPRRRRESGSAGSISVC
jgi:hypothetical protein